MSDTKYAPPLDKLLTLGETDLMKVEDWQDYLALGIGPEHIPDLLRMVDDEAFNSPEAEEPEAWVPVHALRALGQLRDESLIQPLLKILENHEGDEVIQEDIPRVFSLIGPVAIPALSDYLADTSRNMYARSYAGEALREIAERYPEHRSRSIEGITRTLEHFEENDYDLNALLINNLAELKAVETLPLIERAFEAERVEEFFTDLDSVLVLMGLKEPPELPTLDELASRFSNFPSRQYESSDFEVIPPNAENAPVVDSLPVQTSKPVRNFESIKFSRNKPKKKKKKKRR